MSGKLVFYKSAMRLKMSIDGLVGMLHVLALLCLLFIIDNVIKVPFCIFIMFIIY